MRALQGLGRLLDTCRPAGEGDPGRSRNTRLFRCGCCGPRLWRKRRRLWMRLLPFLKLYECERCGARVLASRIAKRRVQPVYLPSAALTHLLSSSATPWQPS
jgi:hypothetical protein